MSRPARLFVLSFAVGCGGARAEPAAAPAPAVSEEVGPTNGGDAPAPVATEEPLSAIPACDGYLRLYRSCEPALGPEIAAGDRRDFVHERAWLDHLAGTPEGAGLAESCSAMTRDLQAVCP